MKVLKWIWFLVFVTLAFKGYGFFQRAYTSDFSGSYSNDIQSFVGMAVIFVIVTVAIIVVWIAQKAKSALSKTSTE